MSTTRRGARHRTRHQGRHQKGLSLIELMVGLTLSAFLILGLVEFFSASQAAYTTNAGLARIQENSRFAVDFLQRDLRMAGHLGCQADTFRLREDDETLYLHMTADPIDYASAAYPVRYDLGIQGYEFTGTAPGDEYSIADVDPAPSGNGGAWSPNLPAALASRAVPGTDVVMLRFFSPDSVSVVAMDFGASSIRIDMTPVENADFVSNGALYGLADCNAGASVLQAQSGAAADGTVSFAAGGLNRTALDPTRELYDLPAGTFRGSARLYRAENYAYYVGQGSNGPSLFRLRWDSALNPVEEELIEGVESLQLLYGLDLSAAQVPVAATDFVTADELDDGLSADEAIDRWRRVVSVRLGLLMRSVENSAAIRDADIRDPKALDVEFTPPEDGRVRHAYENLVALRNRTLGN